MNTEVTLLIAAKEMDNDALTQIFELYAHPLYLYALRCCGDPVRADQVVGDVFAKLLEQLFAGNGPVVNLRAYLYQCAHHAVMDEMRYSHRVAPLETTDFLPQHRFSTTPDIEKRMEVETVLEAMRELSADQRHIIILRILEGFSVAETAVILGKTPGSVKVAQSRAIASLREALITKKSAPLLPSYSNVEIPVSV